MKRDPEPGPSPSSDPPTLSAEELHKLIFETHRDGNRSRRRFTQALLYLHESRLYLKLGFSSTAHYAEKVFGYQRRSTFEFLRVARALGELAMCDREFQTGCMTFSALQEITRVATPQTETEWLTFAKNHSLFELKAEVRDAIKNRRERPRKGRRGIPNLAVKVKFDLLLHEHDLLEKVLDKARSEMGEGAEERSVEPKDALLYVARQFLETELRGEREAGEEKSGPRVRGQDSPYTVLYHRCSDCRETQSMTSEGAVEVPPEVVDSIEAEAKKITILPEEEEAKERPEAGSGERKRVPPSERDRPNTPDLVEKLYAREGNICANPGCRTRDLHGHHLVFRVYGGKTALWNEISLCPTCHSLVHAERLKVEGDPIHGLRWTTVCDAMPLERELDPAEPIPQFQAALGVEMTSENRDSPGECRILHSTALQEGLAGGEVSVEWWRRNRQHFQWSPRRGVWSYEPASDGGIVLEEDAASSAPPNSSSGQILDGFIGQERVRRSLSIAIEAAKTRGDVPPAILLSGPPGLGKTTLAHGVAEALGTRLYTTVGPALSDLGNMVGILAELKRGDVLFVDELHRLSVSVAEYLYSAVDERTVSLSLAFGSTTKVVKLRLEPFLLVGATTEEGRLPKPLLSRFAIREKLAFYPDEDLSRIVTVEAARRRVEVSPKAAEVLASGARGCPRLLLGHLRRAEDLATVERGRAGEPRTPILIEESQAREALASQGIDSFGLSQVDRKILETLLSVGKPLGRRTLADLVGEDRRTLEEVYEPYLLQRGYLIRTRFGRRATVKAADLLLLPPDRVQNSALRRSAVS